MASYTFNILICQHCEEPDSVPACPIDALVLDERGVVVMLDEECNCCGTCASSCPYDAVFYDAPHYRYLKCDLCAGRVQGPLCVELCPVRALALADVDMAVSQEV